MRVREDRRAPARAPAPPSRGPPARPRGPRKVHRAKPARHASVLRLAKSPSHRILPAVPDGTPDAVGRQENAMKRIVHVVGTGTIGEPLIGLFTDFGKHLGVDEVTFHKRTPMTTERAKVNHLIERGAKLAVDSDKLADFEALGHKVVVRGAGGPRAGDRRHRLHAGRQREQEGLREDLGPRRASSPRAASSASGRCTRWGSTTRRSSPGRTASSRSSPATRTTSPASSRRSATDDSGARILTRGRFVCMRRANDVSQDSGFAPAPSAGKHDDPEFGTHHARDAVGAALDDRLGAARSSRRR